jgi:2-methylcitrate dehydratase PrpD
VDARLTNNSRPFPVALMPAIMAEIQIVQNSVRVVAAAVGHGVVCGNLRGLCIRHDPWDLVLAAAGEVVDDAVVLAVALCLLPVYFAVLRVAGAGGEVEEAWG